MVTASSEPSGLCSEHSDDPTVAFTGDNTRPETVELFFAVLQHHTCILERREMLDLFRSGEHLLATSMSFKESMYQKPV